MVGYNRLSLFGVVNGLAMTVFAAIILYPLVYIVSISFSDTANIVQGHVYLFPRGFNVEAYERILTSERVPRAYANTVLYTSVGVAFNLLMTAVAAYPLSRTTFFGRKFFMIAIVLTLFLHGGIIPTYLIVQKLGLLDSMWALVVPNAIWTFYLLVLISFYRNMSESLRESAMMDGASEYRILFNIILPLSKPALASIGLFYFMGHWNSYFLPMLYLNDAKLYPLQLVLRGMLILGGTNETPLMDESTLTPEAMKNATIVLTMLPVLLVYPFAQKYFAKGVMLGAEKG